jgi:hypothetical protein
MEDGEQVSIAGVVRALVAPLHAPLSGQPCVVHVTHARVWSRLDFVGQLVQELLVTEAVEFALVTALGELVIDARHGTVDGPRSRFTPPYHHARMHAFLAPRGLAHFAASTFAEHTVVAPGHRVGIRGTAMRERALSDGERGYRDESERFKLVGYPSRPLEIIHLG